MPTTKTTERPTVPAAADPARDDLGRFKRGGPSGNPNGRPRSGTSLSERIRSIVDKDEMIQIAVEIMRGNPVRVIDGKTKSIGSPAAIPVSMPTAKDQLSAMNWLASYAWSKPPAYKHVAVDDGSQAENGTFEIERLSDTALDQLEGALIEAGLVKGEE